MEHFLTTYQSLQANNLGLLAEIYEKDVVFIDPAHEIRGLASLTDYFNKLYQNSNHISFDFDHPLRINDRGYVQWQMSFSHPSIKKGLNIEVEGATFVRFVGTGKVIYHRDYFDLGSMLYQHIPLLGGVVKTINRRLGK